MTQKAMTIAMIQDALTNSAVASDIDSAASKATHYDRFKYSIMGALCGLSIGTLATAAVIYGLALMEKSSATHNLLYGEEGVVLALGGLMGVALAGIHALTRVLDYRNLCKGCTTAFTVAGLLGGFAGALQLPDMEAFVVLDNTVQPLNAEAVANMKALGLRNQKPALR